jgi:hypothetical protein
MYVVWLEWKIIMRVDSIIQSISGKINNDYTEYSCTSTC